MSDATQFGLSENFPTNLTRLTSALLLGKLALCEKLEGVIETRIVASLMLHLNSTDFRLPVQMMPLSRLAKLSQISKSTLCDKLQNLRMMGILKNSERERQIAFTDEAVSLFRGISEKNQKNEKSEKVHKNGVFGKFGKFWLPRTAAMFLLGRGLKEEAVAGLMAACKDAGRKLQDVVGEFYGVLSRYDGDILGRITRTIIGDPQRFRSQAVHEQPAKLIQTQRLALQRIADAQPELIHAGEKLALEGEHFSWSRPAARGGAPITLTQPMLETLNRRAQRVCERALAEDLLAGSPSMQIAASDRVLFWGGHTDQGLPQLKDNTRQIVTVDWLTLYLALPAAQQALASEDGERDPRIGRWLEHGGVRYQVEDIDGDRVTLYALEANGKRYVQHIKLAQLGSAKVVWLQANQL